MKAAADRVGARMAAAEERVDELECSLMSLVERPQLQAPQNTQQRAQLQRSPQRQR